MPEPRPRRASRWRLTGVAPFGRLGHRLGFRWVFPIGTLAVPFHPVVAWLLPWVPPGLVVWGAVNGDVAWWSLLVAAGVLGLLLSVPILVYVLVAFRALLVQGSLIGGAVLLLALDVVAGRAGWAWGVVPALYVSIYVVQVVGGRVALARLRRGQADVDRVDPPFGLVVAEGPMRHDVARWLLAESATTLVCVDTSTWMRLDPQALARVAELRDQVRVGDRVDGEVYRVPGSESGAVTVRSHDSVTSSWRLVSGEQLRVWDVEAGERRQRLRSGRAEVVGWLPLLVCFHFLAVFGGRSRWVVGFPRRVGADFGEDREVLLRAFVPRPDPPTYADPSGPLATLGALVAERRGRFLATLDHLERTPDRELTRHDLAGLHLVHGAGTAGAGARLCELVDRAKEGASLLLAESAARALAEVPVDELRELTPRLLRITGSRILSLQWEITPDLDVTPLPRGLPKFGDRGGFGLLDRVPDLYRRLGELDDPQVLVVLDGLAAEAGWTPALQDARESYLVRHPA